VIKKIDLKEAFSFTLNGFITFDRAIQGVTRGGVGGGGGGHEKS